MLVFWKICVRTEWRIPYNVQVTYLHRSELSSLILILGTNDPCTNFSCPSSRKCTVDREGKLFCACHKDCKWGDHYTGQVCGRDGKSYKNLCRLKQTLCKKSLVVTVKHFGKCQQYSEVQKQIDGGKSCTQKFNKEKLLLRLGIMTPNRHLLLQSQQWKHRTNVWNLHKVNNKDIRRVDEGDNSVDFDQVKAGWN